MNLKKAKKVKIKKKEMNSENLSIRRIMVQSFKIVRIRAAKKLRTSVFISLGKPRDIRCFTPKKIYLFKYSPSIQEECARENFI